MATMLQVVDYTISYELASLIALDLYFWRCGAKLRTIHFEWENSSIWL